MRFVLIILLFTISGCNKGVQNSVGSTPQQAPENPVCSIERTPCFGTCPVYKAEIYPDGRVVYTGIRFVDVIGVKEGQIPLTDLLALTTAAEKAGFFDMMDRYPSESEMVPSDLPSCITMLRKGDIEKRVTNLGLEAPPALSRLESLIDSVIRHIAAAEK